MVSLEEIRAVSENDPSILVLVRYAAIILHIDDDSSYGNPPFGNPPPFGSSPFVNPPSGSSPSGSSPFGNSISSNPSHFGNSLPFTPFLVIVLLLVILLVAIPLRQSLI